MPVPPRSTVGSSVTPEPAASRRSESWGAGPDPGTPPVPAAPSGVLHSTAAIPPQPLPMPNWPPTTTWPGSAPQATGSMAGALWAGIVVVVLVALGFLLVQRMQSGISFPDTIAGYQHDESQIADAATDYIEKALKSFEVEAKAAIYGDVSTSGFIVIAFETDGSPLPHRRSPGGLRVDRWGHGCLHRRRHLAGPDRRHGPRCQGPRQRRLAAPQGIPFSQWWSRTCCAAATVAGPSVRSLPGKCLRISASSCRVNSHLVVIGSTPYSRAPFSPRIFAFSSLVSRG